MLTVGESPADLTPLIQGIRDRYLQHGVDPPKVGVVLFSNKPVTTCHKKFLHRFTLYCDNTVL